MPGGLTLLIDADDTLWDNNVYYEEVVLTFCRLMEERGHAGSDARALLDRIERVRTRTDGYGIKNFHRSLRLAAQTLVGPTACERELAILGECCRALARRPVVPFPGVEETLRVLSGRHRLILFTKGDDEDQRLKLRRSGLAPFFCGVDVVREKDVDSYRDAVTRHDLRPGACWMVGNSPQSDIRPALLAGLSAVFIPHRTTWTLEQGDLPDAVDGRLLVLDRFTQLTEHF